MLEEKKIPPNLDFYTASAYNMVPVCWCVTSVVCRY